MDFDDMMEAVDEAKATRELCDYQASRMARLIAGRLRVSDVRHDYLVRLKKELRDYNIHTGKWKEG